MTHSDMAGKRILITGAARGIGAETARQLAARGAQVALVGLEAERLATLAAELGPQHIWAECDVSDNKTVTKAVAECIQAFGGLDVVIANAGIASNGTVAVSPVEPLVKTIQVNLIGVVHTVSATLPALTESRGYFLLVSSAAALKSIPGTSAYGASKIGVDHFASSLRLEVAHKGVDVGVVYPAWIDTDLVRDQKRDLDSFNDALKHLPWPFNVVTSVEDCSAALVNAVANRKRKTYVPSALAPIGAVRQFFMSPLWEFFVKRKAKITVPKIEAEVQKLGRSFGSSSMGLGNPSAKDEK
ncbi:MAG: SDR family oxidoreductase [Oleibacter sp.]|nr:SDR family oxidoreductase [Thalassolituus sp.]